MSVGSSYLHPPTHHNFNTPPPSFRPPLPLFETSFILQDWKADLATVNAKASEALADPTAYPNLFPGLEVGEGEWLSHHL